MNNSLTASTMIEKDIQELKTAKQLLENPGIAARITDFIGTPIEKGIKKLPKNWSEKLREVTNDSLLKAANVAIFTMKNSHGEMPSNIWHKISVAASGSVGGLFGLPGLAAELPVSTTIMLRSIADIARSNGENINDIKTKLACLEVFALGGKSKSDDGSESGYYAIRTVLAKSVSEAAQFIAKNGFVEEGAPAIIRLFIKISGKFGIQVTEKIAAQSIPVIGAVGGALINTMFIDHFQDMAKGHFIVRKLERKYCENEIKKAYEKL